MLASPDCFRYADSSVLIRSSMSDLSILRKGSLVQVTDNVKNSAHIDQLLTVQKQGKVEISDCIKLSLLLRGEYGC